MTRNTLGDLYAEDGRIDGEDGEVEIRLSGAAVAAFAILLIGAFSSVGFLAYRQSRGDEDARRPVLAATAAPAELPAADAPPQLASLRAAEAEAVIMDDNGDAPQKIEAEAKTQKALIIVPDPPPLDALETAAQVEPAVAAADPAPPSNDAGIGPDLAAAPGGLTGDHVVQLGAFASREEAEGGWLRAKARLGAVLEGKRYDIERAEIADLGVFHRLRVGPFETGKAARDYCARIAVRGQDCLAMRRQGD